MKSSNKWLIVAILLYVVLIIPTQGLPATEDLVTIGICFFFLVLCVVIILSSVFIHELGHLTCGLLTGFKFESFRTLSFIAYRDEDGKIQSNTDQVTDYSGQCLMRPPEREKFNPFWYLAGGVIFNLIAALIFFYLFYLIKDISVYAETFQEYLIRSLMKLSIVTGLVLNTYMVIVNWFPIPFFVNDGYQTRKARHNKNSYNAIYDYLMINSELNRGKSLKSYNMKHVKVHSENLEDQVQMMSAIYVYERYMLKGKYDKAYSNVVNYMRASKNVISKGIPMSVYMDYYLISLLYFDGNVNIEFNKNHERFLSRYENTLRHAFFILIKNYYENEKVIDEEVYERFIKVARKHPQKTLVAEYMSLFQKVVTQEVSFEIKEAPLQEVLALRHKVMWPQMDLDYVKIDNDEDGMHLGLYDQGQLISVVSLFATDKDVQFRKFATDDNYQDQGYGSKLLNYTFMIMKNKNYNRIWCNARVEKSGYYKRFGLKETDDVFEKEGQKYVIMELKNHQ